jgi:hypothetical protein
MKTYYVRYLDRIHVEMTPQEANRLRDRLDPIAEGPGPEDPLGEILAGIVALELRSGDTALEEYGA